MPTPKDLCEFYRSNDVRKRLGTILLAASLDDVRLTSETNKKSVAEIKVKEWLNYFNYFNGRNHLERLYLSNEQIEQLATNLAASLKRSV